MTRWPARQGRQGNDLAKLTRSCVRHYQVASDHAGFEVHEGDRVPGRGSAKRIERAAEGNLADDGPLIGVVANGTRLPSR